MDSIIFPHSAGCPVSGEIFSLTKTNQDPSVSRLQPVTYVIFLVSFINLRYIPYIPVKCWVVFLTSWASTWINNLSREIFPWEKLIKILVFPGPNRLHHAVIILVLFIDFEVYSIDSCKMLGSFSYILNFTMSKQPVRGDFFLDKNRSRS